MEITRTSIGFESHPTFGVVRRGENIVLLGELDEMKEKENPVLKEVSPADILEAEAALKESGQMNVRTMWNFDNQ